MEKKEIIKKALKYLDLNLREKQYDQFLKFYELLLEWNKVMNLTTITQYEEVIYKHFLDSLSLIKVYDLEKPARILDLGTGAGFPGIPLKIVYPHLEIILLDSLNKRVKFLEEVILQLGLENIKAIHGRAEDLGNLKEYRESFDVCVSRAVSRLSSLSEYCIPFVKNRGKFIAYKSGHIEEEVLEAEEAVRVLGGRMEKVDKFVLPGTNMERAFVIVNKYNTTPKIYPRNAGKPGKEPIVKK